MYDGAAAVRLSAFVPHAVVHVYVVNSVESAPSAPPVTVDALPGPAVETTRPSVDGVLYECGKVVPVGGLVPSTRVHVYEDGGEIGVAPAAPSRLPVVTARQFGCEGTGHQIDGLPPIRTRPRTRCSRQRTRCSMRTCTSTPSTSPS